MQKFEFQLKCGCVKKGQKWVIDNPKANIVIFEGMEEHVSRYDKFACFLNKNGYSVYGTDVFGQGENVEPDLSNLGVWPEDGFAKQANHFDQLITYLNENTGVPTYVFAHSMGSFYGQYYLEQYAGHINKIVLCGSGGKNPALKIAKVLAKMSCTKKKEQEKAKLLANLMFGSFNSHIKNPRTPYDWLSINEENVDRYLADPLCGFGPRNRFCLEFIKGMIEIYKKPNLKKFNPDTKIFLITGEEDPVTNYGKFIAINEKMFKDNGVKEVQTKIYPKLRHEILNELSWEEVAQDIVNFYNQD